MLSMLGTNMTIINDPKQAIFKEMHQKNHLLPSEHQIKKPYAEEKRENKNDDDDDDDDDDSDNDNDDENNPDNDANLISV